MMSLNSLSESPERGLVTRGDFREFFDRIKRDGHFSAYSFDEEWCSVTVHLRWSLRTLLFKNAEWREQYVSALLKVIEDLKPVILHVHLDIGSSPFLLRRIRAAVSREVDDVW